MLKWKWNRLLALLTAMIMALSLTVPAFAAEDGENGGETNSIAEKHPGRRDSDDDDDEDDDKDDDDDRDEDSDKDDDDDRDEDSDKDDDDDKDEDNDKDDNDDKDEDNDKDDNDDKDEDDDKDNDDDKDEDDNKDNDDDKDEDDDKDDDDDKDEDDDKDDDDDDAAMNYTDVSDKNWYYDAVSFAVQNHLIDGKDETTFAPGEDMTRQMLAVALYRLAGSPEVAAENPFTDVADTAAYRDAVVWAYSTGVVNGVTDTTFSPDNSIRRQDIASMLARYAHADTAGESDLSAFTDAGEIQSYAKGPLGWAVEKGLIKGNDKGAVEPRGNATRAQVAAILERFAPMVEDVQDVGTSDEDARPAEGDTGTDNTKTDTDKKAA